VQLTLVPTLQIIQFQLTRITDRQSIYIYIYPLYIYISLGGKMLINNLSTACYVIRLVKPCVSLNVVIMTYHSLLHAVMTYG
jgi:hypothetical protein